MHLLRHWSCLLAILTLAVEMGCASPHPDPRPTPIRIQDEDEDQGAPIRDDYRNCDPIPTPIDGGVPKLLVSYPRELLNDDVATLELHLLSQTAFKLSADVNEVKREHGAYTVVIDYKKENNKWKLDGVKIYGKGINGIKVKENGSTYLGKNSTENDVDIRFKSTKKDGGRFVRALRVEARDNLVTIPFHSVVDD